MCRAPVWIAAAVAASLCATGSPGAVTSPGHARLTVDSGIGPAFLSSAEADDDRAVLSDASVSVAWALSPGTHLGARAHVLRLGDAWGLARTSAVAASLERTGRTCDLALSVGLGRTHYDVHFPSRAASGDIGGAFVGIDAEWRRGAFGARVTCDLHADEQFAFAQVKPGLTLRAAPDVSVHVFASFLWADDGLAAGGALSFESTGIGIGIRIRESL